jgi:hypothetical protein
VGRQSASRLIAALTRQHRLPLFSFGAHFAAMPGLALVDPAG